MNMTARVLAALLPIMAASTVTGCAVTRIDVDVYKGPLANEEHVQAQQFAAMAIGAKPLLVQLRDLIQWTDADKRDKKRTDPRYYARFIPTTDPRNPFISDEQAQRVNAVLSLYEDTGDQKLAELLRAVAAAFEEYQEAEKVLRQNEKDKELLQRMSGMLREKSDLDESYRPNETDFESFKKYYSKFLVPKTAKRKGKRLKCLDCWYQRVLGNHENRDEASCKGKAKENPDSRCHVGRVDAYGRLMSDNHVARHAQLLFKDPASPIAAEFVDHVQGIASAYFVARDAVRRMWLVSLEALIHVDSERFRKESRSRTSVSRITELVTHLVVALTQTEHLAATINTPVYMPNATSESQQAIKNLRNSLMRTARLEPSLCPTRPTKKFWKWPRCRLTIEDDGTQVEEDDKLREFVTPKVSDELSDFDKARVSFQKALFLHPTDMASWLLTADEYLRNYAKRLVDKDDQTRRLESHELAIVISIAELHDYGLSRGPSLKDEEEDLLTDIIPQVVSDISAAGAVGFETGRLHEGIETLIEEYLEAAEKERSSILSASYGLADSNQDSEMAEVSVSEARDRLNDALVRFAEKVLVIANNEVLFRDQKRLAGLEKELDRYTLVLQAIGNSILIQANELREREVYKQEIAKRDRAKAEQWALEQSLSRSSKAVLEDVILAIEGDLAATEAAIKVAEEKREISSEEFEEAKQKAKTAGDESEAADDDKPDKEQDLRDAEKQLERTEAAHDILTGDDSAKIRAEAVADGDDSDGDDSEVQGGVVADKIVVWLKAKRDLTSPLSTELEDYGNAIEYFEPTSRFNAIVDNDRGMIFDEILATLEDNKAQAEEAEVRMKAALEGLEQNIEEKKSAAETAKEKEEIAKAEDEKAEADLEDVEKKKERLEQAIDAIADVRDAVVAQADAAGGDAPVTFALLVAAINDALADANTATTDKDKLVAKFTSARDTLVDLPPPQGTEALESLPLGSKEDTKDVLDKMIALLRHQHLVALREGGETNKRATNIKAAIEAANEHRSGMIYIRPSSAYLRSSYPSTGLQDNPRLAWENMLAGHSIRSMPLFGSFLTNADSSRRIEIQTEIDKQFWQTINSVRVAGGGITNYVMVKDDIGNWYVKKYSADPEPIIRSARNLAMFGAGLPVSSSEDDNGISPTARLENSQLGRLFMRHEANFDARTEHHYERLLDLLREDTIEEDIQVAWNVNSSIGEEGDSSRDKLDDALEEAVERLPDVADALEARLADDDDDVDRGTLIVSGLNDLRGFFHDLRRRIQLIPDLDPNIRNNAVEEARVVVRRRLEAFAKDRQATVKSFETSVEFIGEANNQ